MVSRKDPVTKLCPGNLNGFHVETAKLVVKEHSGVSGITASSRPTQQPLGQYLMDRHTLMSKKTNSALQTERKARIKPASSTPHSIQEVREEEFFKEVIRMGKPKQIRRTVPICHFSWMSGSASTVNASHTELTG